MMFAVAILAFYGTSEGTTAFTAPTSGRPSSHCLRRWPHPVPSTLYSTTTTSLRMTATSTTTAIEEPMEDDEPLERDRAETSTTSTTGGDDLQLGDGSTITERMFQKIPSEQQAGGAGGSSTYKAFLRADENWSRLKEFHGFAYDTKLLQFEQQGMGPSSQFVSTDGAFGNPACWKTLRNSIGQTQLDYDVVVCGGTLGIFYGMYLQLQGHRVCVVEGGKLRGREQEWNISMDELDELVDLGVLTPEDVEAVITTEFPACRSGFKNQEVTPLTGGYFENDQTGYECYTVSTHRRRNQCMHWCIFQLQFARLSS